MKKMVQGIFLITFTVIMSGCATDMPLQNGSSTVDTSTKSLLVGKLRVKNEFKPSFQPKLLNVAVTQNGETSSFGTPFLINDLGKEGKEYFYSLPVSPGKATISNMVIQSFGFLVVGSGIIPVNQSLNVPSNSVVYVGNLDASLIKRPSSDYVLAGSIIPLIDQAVTGYSDGTYKSTVTNDYDADVKLLKSKFPTLSNVEVKQLIIENPKYTK